MTTPEHDTADTENTAEAEHKKPRRRWRRAKLTAVVIVATVGSITPWPSAMVIRAVFTQGGDATAAEMDAHIPDTELTETLDVAYGDDGVDTTMDVFTPKSATGPLPTVVWIHGGAW